ncbi:uncharacterized protein LOC104849030 [Fukomys damarensis]|uniref:uncharacterized protein LOC104849030 n=1 Tax=Fukomys damarensis TaxID=885580 RepID=UPI0008FF4B2E|nr:uncharacterized protein LOC104849030 [Fukomys damarensis]
MAWIHTANSEHLRGPGPAERALWVTHPGSRTVRPLGPRAGMGSLPLTRPRGEWGGDRTRWPSDSAGLLWLFPVPACRKGLPRGEQKSWPQPLPLPPEASPAVPAQGSLPASVWGTEGTGLLEKGTGHCLGEGELGRGNRSPQRGWSVLDPHPTAPRYAATWGHRCLPKGDASQPSVETGSPRWEPRPRDPPSCTGAWRKLGEVAVDPPGGAHQAPPGGSTEGRGPVSQGPHLLASEQDWRHPAWKDPPAVATARAGLEPVAHEGRLLLRAQARPPFPHLQPGLTSLGGGELPMALCKQEASDMAPDTAPPQLLLL